MSQPSKTCLAGNDIFTVAHFHSKSESDEIIMLSESNGFEAETVHTASDHQSRSDWRNNTRVIIARNDRLPRWARICIVSESFNRIDSVASNWMFGASIANSEIAVRQYLLTRILDINFKTELSKIKEINNGIEILIDNNLDNDNYYLNK